ncbi:MAG: sarcosine oxidase subunit delta [Litoreibacter sp.]
MRIKCPYCGERDRREFYVKGAVDTAEHPKDAEAVHRALHLRANVAGVIRELWHHEGGCRAWLVVERHTLTHEIISVQGAADAG